ncbi:hypothetical protein COT48_03455, partial [Candidatus Woesearchaeota archaeon CG08_land_8_20_14_0_20_47_9]
LNESLYIGSDHNQANKANATIDELRISSAARTSYANLTSTNLTTATLEDNHYYWRIKAYGL